MGVEQEEDPSYAGPSMDDVELQRLKCVVLAGLLGQRAHAPTIARYSILRRLGEGGMGVVYAAYDEQLDRRVAIKVIKGRDSTDDGGLRQRMLREGQAMARLSHPNVVPVFEVGEDEGDLFLAMEYVEGKTLRDWLEDGPRTWREILAMYLQAARGLLAAHGAGLLHRDFKPDNAIVGDDGRVRVLDFGLARALASPPDTTQPAAVFEPTEPTEPSTFEQALTRVGAAVGTPAYMAPEQFLGEEVDARTDVFAWCVSLFEALYGERPYPATNRAALIQAVTLGQHVAPRSDRAVPAWIERVVLRGLMPSKDDRPASMQEILDLLDVDPDRRRKRIQLAVGLAIVGGTAAAAGFLGGGTTRETPCSGLEARLAGVWDDALRDAVAEAFATSGSPFADEAWRDAAPALDRHAQSLVGAMEDVCTATRITKEQSEVMLDTKMGCLAERTRAMQALTGVLAGADKTTVAHAAGAIEALPDPAPCLRNDFVTSGLPVPADAAQAEAVAAARDVAAEGTALLDTGHVLDARARVEDALGLASPLHYGPLDAEVAHLSGRVDTELGRFVAARDALLDAVDVAESVRHDAVVAAAWTDLVYLATEARQDPERADSWVRRANAAILRLGDPDAARIGLLRRQTNLAIEYGLLERAQTHLEALRALLENRADGADAADATSDAFYRGRLARARGLTDDAVQAWRDRLASVRASRGEHHPNVARARHNLGTALLEQGRLDEATTLLQAAERGWREAFGDANVERARTLIALGQLAVASGRFDDADAAMTEAVAATRDSVGADHPLAADALIGLGAVAFLRGDLPTAETHNRRALAILDQAYDRERPERANAAANLGETLLYRGKLAEAKPLLRRASLAMQQTMGAEHPDRALPLKLLGLVLLLEGAPEAAVEPLAQARALVADGRPYERADIVAALAVATFPSDPAAARTLASHPHAALLDESFEQRRAALIDLLDQYRPTFEQLELVQP